MTGGLPIGGVLASALKGAPLPESVLQSGAFSVLAVFVAINTVMYGSLAVAKMLPKVYLDSWFGGRNRREQNRSIHPTPPDAG